MRAIVTKHFLTGCRHDGPFPYAFPAGRSGELFSSIRGYFAPPALTSFIHDGNFDPSDYGFVRGAFPDATAQQVADWKAIEAYGKACMHDAALVQDAELKKLGIAASVPEHSGYQDHVCLQVNMAAAASASFKSWEDFQTAMSQNLPYFQIYEAAVHNAVQALESNPEKDTLEEQLTARILPDQMWRFPMMGRSLQQIAGLDASTYAALSSRISLTVINVDWDNSHWARHVLETQGWASVLKAGHKPAKMLWTLVQHADVDPVFQVMALRQLEPLARSGSVSETGICAADGSGHARHDRKAALWLPAFMSEPPLRPYFAGCGRRQSENA
ncbi:MAG: hypothetical protein ABF761_07560 [Gluconobacter potus]